MASLLSECVDHPEPKMFRPNWFDGGLGVAFAAIMLRERDPSLFSSDRLKRLLGWSFGNLRQQTIDSIGRGYFGALVCLALFRKAGVTCRLDAAALHGNARHALTRRACSSEWSMFDFDLINGAAGMVAGLELLADSEHGFEAELTAAWLERLERITAQRLRVMRGELPLNDIDRRMGRCYGIAHGIAGAIAVVMRLRGAVDGPLRDELHRGFCADEFGPYLAVMIENRALQRAAWCNGLPGVAAALAPYADALGIRAALADGMGAIARRPWDRQMLALPDGTHDLGTHESLCHGIAGLALCLATYRAFNPDPELAAFHDRLCAQLEAWLEERCASFTPGKDDCSFMLGLSGLIAALLALHRPALPWWAGLLLFPGAGALPRPPATSGVVAP